MASIVTSGIYIGWNSFYISNQASTMSNDVTTIIQNTQSLYSKSSIGYSGISTTVGINGNVFPTSLSINSTAGTVSSAFGLVSLASYNSNAQFTVTYTNVPSGVCTKVLTSISTANLSGFSTDVSTALWPNNGTFPTIANITLACKPKSSSSSGLTITFISN